MPTKEEMLNFAKSIENLVAKYHYNYIDAVVQYCEETGLEIEVAASLINQNLKSKIQNDAVEINMIKEKGNKLPI
jgi:hypothetical protein